MQPVLQGDNRYPPHNKKGTLVKYEFNTRDEHGNKVMDKMSKEETLQTMKDIRSQYGDAVIVEFSGNGMAALVEGRKGSMVSENKEATEAGNAALQKGGRYERQGNYLIPCLTVPVEEEQPIGTWG